MMLKISKKDALKRMTDMLPIAKKRDDEQLKVTTASEIKDCERLIAENEKKIADCRDRIAKLKDDPEAFFKKTRTYGWKPGAHVQRVQEAIGSINLMSDGTFMNVNTNMRSGQDWLRDLMVMGDSAL